MYIVYSASASHIQLGLWPHWIWDADALYFSYIHERACDNVFIFKQTWRVTIEHTRRMVVILAVQYRFLSPLHSANVIGGLART